MNLFSKKIKVVTHDGGFHADESFACAALSLWAEKRGYRLQVIRGRGKEAINKADILVDIGMIYDPDKNRFDHHQKGGAGEHENGIPYSSFGLVWKKFGTEICNSKEVSKMIDNKLVMPIDALDNGINTTKMLRADVPEYRIMKEMVYAFRPDFLKFLAIAKEILIREIILCKRIVFGETKVNEEIKKQQEPEILILEEDLPWERIASRTQNIKLVVYTKQDPSLWYAEAVMSDVNDYESHRTKFPKEWRGLIDEELANVSGVKGAIFCHRNGFLAINKSKEGALEMAQIALQNLGN